MREVSPISRNLKPETFEGMKTQFTKMQGAGNDFVVFDNRDGKLALTEEDVCRICDRRFGIGADGILLLEAAPDTEHQARMVYYNADGSRGEMCGNGARCFTAFALARQVGKDGELRFLSDAGSLTARARDGVYVIQMTPPVDLDLHVEVPLKAGPATVHSINTGVPHVVKFVEDLAAVAIREEGSELRHHPRFAPKGANVNFARLESGNQLRIRTYERGVEDETLACGTGVTATAIVAHLLHNIHPPIAVRVAGGDLLTIDFRKAGGQVTDVTLSGPAKVVFTGTLDLTAPQTPMIER